MTNNLLERLIGTDKQRQSGKDIERQLPTEGLNETFESEGLVFERRTLTYLYLCLFTNLRSSLRFIKYFFVK